MLLWILAAVFGTILVTMLAMRELSSAILLPALAKNAYASGKRDAARRLFELVIARRSLLGGSSRRDARYRLAWIYMEQGRREEALQQLQALLSQRPGPGFEAMVRLRLAECLELMDRAREAAEERTRAKELSEVAPADPAALIAQAGMRARERRFSEAADLYEQAIPRMPPWNTAGRSFAMLKLALARFEAGQPQEAVRWAEETLELNPDQSTLLSAHNVAALGYGHLGDLDRCEEHRRKALAIATQMGNADQIANFIALLAQVQRRRGQIQEAIRNCEHAVSLSLKARRIARISEYECFCSLGRFQEAREMLEQASRAQGLVQADSEGRSQAIHALGRASLDCEEGKAEEARRHLEEAASELAREEKLGLICAALQAWVCSLQGERDAAFAQMAKAEEMAQKLEGSRGTQLDCFSKLGRAALCLQEWDRAETYWRRYLAIGPDPVEVPRGWYYLGETYAGQARPEEARFAYERAVGSGLETHHTRLARERLDAARVGSSP